MHSGGWGKSLKPTSPMVNKNTACLLMRGNIKLAIKKRNAAFSILSIGTVPKRKSGPDLGTVMSNVYKCNSAASSETFPLIKKLSQS